ncbi:hypothetical protein A6R68_15206 [Neotoma lepida]|uniref:Uncharacterized protein n=1 Tax=Neotoma lepida TaxID=56216 RepID=A0A1A6H8Q1_NEOLE|nr:hypothetical protein A6R68_15206 [Neotoma lepida]
MSLAQGREGLNVLMELPEGLWLRLSSLVLEEVVGRGQEATAPLISDDTRTDRVHWLLYRINRFNACPGRQC